MAPTLLPGDTVYIERFSPENYAVGDIIVFNMTLFLFTSSSSDNIWIHRIVARTQAYGYFWYMTKGDNNTISDPVLWASYNMNISEPAWFGRGWVRQDLILGCVVEVVHKGG
jgi:signal peptidase I